MKLLVYVVVLLQVNFLVKVVGDMDCGEGVDLCGVLVLESGSGKGYYMHKVPQVHGLWPQVGRYGSSKCVLPQDQSPPTEIFPCYKDLVDKVSPIHQLQFEIHEWKKHGMCSGTSNATDYFTQICNLSADPLRIISSYSDLSSMASALTSANYPVYQKDVSHQQLYLSACFRSNQSKWILSAVGDFTSNCS